MRRELSPERKLVLGMTLALEQEFHTIDDPDERKEALNKKLVQTDLRFTLERDDPDPVAEPAFLGFLGQTFRTSAERRESLPFGSTLTGLYSHAVARTAEKSSRWRPVEGALEEGLPWTLAEFSDDAGNSRRDIVHASRREAATDALTIPHLPGGRQLLAERPDALLATQAQVATDFLQVDRLVCFTWASEDQERVLVELRSLPGKQLSDWLQASGSVSSKGSVNEGYPRLEVDGLAIEAKKGYVAVSLPVEGLKCHGAFSFPPLSIPGFAAQDNANAFREIFASW